MCPFASSLYPHMNVYTIWSLITTKLTKVIESKLPLLIIANAANFEIAWVIGILVKISCKLSWIWQKQWKISLCNSPHLNSHSPHVVSGEWIEQRWSRRPKKPLFAVKLGHFSIGNLHSSLTAKNWKNKKKRSLIPLAPEFLNTFLCN